MRVFHGPYSTLRAVFKNPTEIGAFIVIYLALAIRLSLAAFTNGTYDVGIWQRHLSSIMQDGMLDYYASSRGAQLAFNHPPLMGALMVGLFKACNWAGVEFAFVYRLLIGASDFVAAWLLFRLLAGRRHGNVAVSVYLLAPVTFVLSSYHGNTDSLVGLFALASLGALAGGQYALAGLLLGLGASVKWIIFLAAPALFFGIPSWRKRMVFCGSIALALLVGYGWWMAQNASVVLKSVFGYQGQMFFSLAGEPIWGNQIIFRAVMRIFGFREAAIQSAMEALFRHNGAIILTAVLLFCLLRRRRNDIQDIGATIAGSFCIFYAATNYWSFQYFAWAVPFYFFLDRKWWLLLAGSTSAYLYFLYAYFCGSWWLAGHWDFVGLAHWPFLLLVLRDITLLLQVLAAIDCLRRAVSDPVGSGRWRPWPSRLPRGEPPARPCDRIDTP